MVAYQQNDDKRFNRGRAIPEQGPIEPGGEKVFRLTVFRWLFLGIVLIYFLLTYFHDPMLKGLGRYLVVGHPLQKSDLVVCLAGANVERGLAAADAYRKASFVMGCQPCKDRDEQIEVGCIEMISRTRFSPLGMKRIFWLTAYEPVVNL